MHSQLSRYFWVLIIAFSIISTGILGFKTDADCARETGTAKALCYHQAAISYAAVGERANAIRNCNNIKTVAIDTAYGQANVCFGDIAVLIKDGRGLLDEGICDNIQEDPTAIILSGADITKNACKEKVRNMNRARNYQCALFYIFPLALGLAIYFRKHP